MFENLGTSAEARIPILFLAPNLGPHQAPYGIIAQSMRHGLNPPTPSSLGVEILTCCHTSSTKDGTSKTFCIFNPLETLPPELAEEGKMPVQRLEKACSVSLTGCVP
jgi:hypothetical protein